MTPSRGASAPECLLFLDFDGTITTCDTTSLIAPSDDELAVAHPTFSEIGEQYASDAASFRQAFGTITTREDLLRYIHAMGEFEHRCMDAIQARELFRGTTHAQRQRRVPQVLFQRGWVAMSEWITAAARRGVLETHIVSVSWSSRFVCDSLAFVRGMSGQEDVLTALGLAGVHANEPDIDAATGRGTGRLHAPPSWPSILASASDKLGLCQSIAARTRGAWTVYVGDSLTDWPCLLWADVGVVMGTSPTLWDALRQVGWDTVLVTPDVWLRLPREQRRRRRVHVSSWNEVRVLLEALEEARPCINTSAP